MRLQHNGTAVKTTKYRLDTELERLSTPGQEVWFKEHLQQVLQSDKPYYAKADTIARAFWELNGKIDYIAQEIQSLNALKKRLKEARAKGLQIAAQLLSSYGIDRLEGVAVSSLSVTPSREKIEEKMCIEDPEKVMALGYVAFHVDEEAVKRALREDPDEAEALRPFVRIERTVQKYPAKLRINRRRLQSQTVDTTETDLSFEAA